MNASQETPIVTPANRTNDAVGASKCWVAALTAINAERKTANLLSKEGFETFVPVQIKNHKWSDRINRIQRVIIPMIFSLHLRKEELSFIKSRRIVHYLLCFPSSPNIPAQIPDEQIETLKFRLKESDTPVGFDKQIFRRVNLCALYEVL